MHHQIKDIIRRFLRHAVLDRAADEEIPLLLQDFRLLMPHRAPQQIRLPQAETAHDGRNAHDLLLIKDDAVCFL